MGVGIPLAKGIDAIELSLGTSIMEIAMVKDRIDGGRSIPGRHLSTDVSGGGGNLIGQRLCHVRLGISGADKRTFANALRAHDVIPFHRRCEGEVGRTWTAA